MKKQFFQFTSLALLLFGLTFAWSCKKDESEPAKTAPTGVTTSAAASITPTGATIPGTVATNGGETLLSRGAVYSKTNTTPNLEDDVIELASGTDIGAFSVALTGLDGSTKYYVRAFATNSVGISYGSVVEFTTSTAATVPSVTTTAANAITTTTAKSGGDVVNDGGAAVTEKGIYWGEMANPGPSNGGNKVDGGSGTGSFISSITGLTEATTYHVRAYAKNSIGTGFGEDLTFSTQTTGSPQVSTKALSARTNTGVTSGGTISDQGGAGQTVTEWGLVWSTNATPTLANGTKVTGVAPFSSFNVSLTGLTSKTKIYIRAYATNSPGNKTGYGQILSYIPPPTSVNGLSRSYNTVIIGEQVWFAKNLNEDKYRDGTVIGEAFNATQWIEANNNRIPKVRFIVDGEAEIFCGYYNYYAVVNSRNLCPAGWKVPSNEDFTKLIDYLGGVNNASGKLKTTSSLWASPNTGATNSSGFSAEPAGQIDFSSGNRRLVYNDASFWTNTELNTPNAYHIALLSNQSYVYRGTWYKGQGMPVRCIMEQ